MTIKNYKDIGRYIKCKICGKTTPFGIAHHAMSKKYQEKLISRYANIRRIES